jgi:hypothetical protein
MFVNLLPSDDELLKAFCRNLVPCAYLTQEFLESSEPGKIRVAKVAGGGRYLLALFLRQRERTQILFKPGDGIKLYKGTCDRDVTEHCALCFNVNDK